MDTASMAELLTCLPLAWEVCSSNPGLGQISTALQIVRHRFNTYASSCVALALWRRDGHRQLVTHFGVIRRVLVCVHG